MHSVIKSSVPFILQRPTPQKCYFFFNLHPHTVWVIYKVEGRVQVHKMDPAFHDIEPILCFRAQRPVATSMNTALPIFKAQSAARSRIEVFFT